MKPRTLRALLWFAASAIAGAAEGPRTPGDAAVEMPAFVITETRSNERAWRYAAAEGFEIISQVGDDATQQVFAALWRGPRLTLPPELWPRTSTPTAVILFDRESDRGVDALGTVRRTNEQSSHWTNVIKRTLPDREIFCLNLRGTHFTYSSTFRFDLRTHLALHTPPAPPWLIEALYGSYGLYREGIEYPDRGKITGVVRALWCNEAELLRADGLAGPAHEHFNTPPAKRRGHQAGPAPLHAAMSPLAGLWSGGFSDDRRAPADVARWAATCALFARWAMYAEGGKRHDAFWRFAVKACEQIVDEAFFQECFGLNFAAAQDEVAWFLPIALAESATREIRPLIVPRLTVRAATSAEVARVRGDWERGEASLLTARFPEIAAKYAAKAGNTLRLAHHANPHDAELAAVLGLYEYESGNAPRALELLTAASATGQARPRAWTTVAQLRLLASNPAEGAPRTALPHSQALTILLPLEQAWRQAPAMPVSYEVLAELWRRCPELPAAEMIARLQEGQRTFPRNPRLTSTALRACIERGERAAALGLLEAALPFTSDPVWRDRFEKMREALRRAENATPREQAK